MHSPDAAPVADASLHPHATALPTTTPHYRISTDGSCRGTDLFKTPGGWAAVIHRNDRPAEPVTISGWVHATTNNRMEQTAAIFALEHVLKAHPEGSPAVLLRSDSQYVIKGMNEWRHTWKRKGWRKADKKEVENLDLWQRLDALDQEVGGAVWEMVKGHSGDQDNETADKEAKRQMELAARTAFSGAAPDL